jgi:hypothetical protein
MEPAKVDITNDVIMDVKNVDGLEYLATIPEVDRPYPDRSAVYHFAGAGFLFYSNNYSVLL